MVDILVLMFFAVMGLVFLSYIIYMLWWRCVLVRRCWSLTEDVCFSLLHPRFTPQTEVSVVFAGVIKRNPSVVENECIYPRKAGVPVAVSILGWLVSFIAVSVSKLPATDLLMLPMFQGVEPRPGHDGSLWAFMWGWEERSRQERKNKWRRSGSQTVLHSAIIPLLPSLEQSDLTRMPKQKL